MRLHPIGTYLPKDNRLAGPAGPLYPSRAAVSHRDRLAFHDDRHLALALGQFQHLVQFLGFFLDVDVVMLAVSLPGPRGVRSAGLAVDRDIVTHAPLLSAPPRAAHDEWGWAPFGLLRSCCRKGS